MTSNYLIIKSKDRYNSKFMWLNSFFLFSFAEYWDPNNSSFWSLRVFNDDRLDWNNWFPMHHHSNMEILTIMLDWELTHEDSLWNKVTSYKWDIQTMSAWYWIFHSEINNWINWNHLYQIWFSPRDDNSEPWYENININLLNNKINLLVSWNKKDWVWYLNSDIKVYRAIFDWWKSFDYNLWNWNKLFVYLKDGSILFDNNIISKEDQIRISNMDVCSFKILENSDIIIIEIYN